MLARAKKPARQQTTQVAHLAAPTGGLNTVDPATTMPPTDCVYAYNVIASEQGLRARLGYQEWVTGLTGVTDNTVRSVIPFVGSHLNGSTNKLFATTSTGIWDCSSGTGSPSQLVTFSTQSGDAGFGMSTVMATPAGRFLVYCDEENGLYIYPESSGTWSKISAGTRQAWASSTAYASGNKVANGGNVYTCTTGGTSGTTGPSGTSTGITDGSVTWDYVSAETTTAIGPSLADQNAGFTADPASFVFATAWKSRLWFVEKTSSRAWYLDTNSVYGTATSFDFGSKMRAGGPLVGLYNWSYDGGGGMDTLLVGLSTAGDVVIYEGTDPTSATTFGLSGCWFVGGVPYGRRIATDYGGDVLVLSTLGVLPLSKLVIGNSVLDRSQYATAKISNLFNQLAQTYSTLQGWALYVHPTDNALLVTVPAATGSATNQLAMSFATRGWSQYRSLPILSAGVWAGQLYFGTADGRVCINTGYVDNVLRTNSNSYSPVAYSVLPAFRDGGDARLKQVRMLRANMLADTPNPLVQLTAKYDLDSLEPSPPSGTGVATSGTWDNATWDTSIWGGDYTPSTTLVGATGIGRFVSVAIQGNAITRTTVAGVDIFFEEGGYM